MPSGFRAGMTQGEPAVTGASCLWPQAGLLLVGLSGNQQCVTLRYKKTLPQHPKQCQALHSLHVLLNTLLYLGSGKEALG